MLSFVEGLLPKGIHRVSHTEFAQFFVLGFPDSTTRAKIYEGYRRLYWEVTEFGVASVAWLNGSFVTDKLNPRDLDLVFFVNPDRYNRMSTAQKRAFDDLMGPRTKEDYDCDAYPVMVYPEGSGEKYHLYQASIAEWTRLFRKVRWRKGVTKGFVEVDLNADSPPRLDDLKPIQRGD